MTSTELPTKFPKVFPSRAPLDRIPLQSKREFPPPFCRPHSVPPPSLRQLCTHGNACHPSLSTATAGEHSCHRPMAGHWLRRLLHLSLSGPVESKRDRVTNWSWEQIYLPSSRAAATHFEMLWPQKMPHTAWKRCSHETLILFLSSMDRRKTSLLNSQNQCIYSSVTGWGWGNRKV